MKRNVYKLVELLPMVFMHAIFMIYTKNAGKQTVMTEQFLSKWKYHKMYFLESAKQINFDRIFFSFEGIRVIQKQKHVEILGEDLWDGTDIAERMSDNLSIRFFTNGNGPRGNCSNSFTSKCFEFSRWMWKKV